LIRKEHEMELKLYTAALLMIAGTAQPAFAGSQKSWATASDIGAYGLTAISIGVPLVEHDRSGALQAAGSFAAAQIATQSLKRIFPEIRPDGSDNNSFPSGHTASAFAAAASIYERQGAKAGIPAFALAGLVGIARVKADKHYWYDVVAGAGIGLASGLLITRKPGSKAIAAVPWGDRHGGGVSVAMRF
jgi:membrane-associated phospholipid phosphatase